VDPLTTLLTTTTGVGATYVIARRLRRRAQQQAVARRLHGYDVELPLDTRHLSPGLASLATGARTLRLVLETPLLRAFEAQRETSFRLGQSITEYDSALADARHALWQWLMGVRHLSAADYALLRTLQLDPRPLRTLMFKPGVFDRCDDVYEVFPALPDLELVVSELCRAIEQLRRFEVALLSYRSDPYR
jgi:hypothetical protein